MNFETDVRAVLPTITVPTLLMHCSEMPDELIPSTPVAAYMAERVPRAEVVAVPLRPAWLEMAVPPLQEFVPRVWAERQEVESEPERVLATVLFTDLVASTAKAVEVGPRWQELLAEHNAVIRRELVRYRGREIDTAGDGFFASGFDGPARAIQCGCAIRDAITTLGFGIRVGVHTGECDLIDGKLSGLAVMIGARIAARADEGEVLVSRTVRELVAGSGIEFESRGVSELKGLGECALYAVAP
jgi:class 3 adenylate cyclase